LPSGVVLNQGAATLQWIADQNPGSIAPVNGTEERYQVISWLNVVASEVHPNIGGFFNPTLTEDTKAYLGANAARKLNYLNNTFENGKKFLVGDSATIADFYLYIVLSWAPWVKLDLTPYPNVVAYFENIKSLPVVVAAHARIAESPATIL
jgi:glutathione S-transferase